MIGVTRKYRFAESHRLHTPRLGEPENMRPVRLYATPGLWVDYRGRTRVIAVTRRYRFAAWYRLHTPRLGERENMRSARLYATRGLWVDYRGERA